MEYNNQALADLQDLVRVRRRCVDEIGSLGRLDQELGAKPALRHLRKVRAAIEREVKAVDKDLLAAIEADAGLRRRAEVLRSIPGVGPVTAAGLLAAMPECGGRAEPRCVVYMAALAAIRCNPPLAAFTSASATAARKPRWPSSPSCASSSPSPTPSSAPTASLAVFRAPLGGPGASLRTFRHSWKSPLTSSTDAQLQSKQA